MKPALGILLVLVAVNSGPMIADTLTNSSEEQLELRPPLPEIPPSFWEANRSYIVGAAVALLAGFSAGAFLWARPRRPVEVPPAVVAKSELQSLRDRPENGATLSRISHTVRSYLQAAFHLGHGEMTTTEVSRALQQRPEAGSELAQAAHEFLLDCDVRKFAPIPPSHPGRALDGAVKLVELAEHRIRSHSIDSQAATSGGAGTTHGSTAAS
jgi:hypothetical protein